MRAVLLGLLTLVSAAFAIEPVTIEAANRMTADAPSWHDLVAQFEQQPDTAADFVERRFFPFRKEPVILKGQVRVSRSRGLSLHYVSPEERIVILDQQGVLMRESTGPQAPPDPRANLANSALLNILRFDFPALEKEYEIFGHREGAAWTLGLVPRAEAVRRAIGNIFVTGEGTTVETIALRRSAKQHIEIEMSATRRAPAFTAEELKTYFR